MDEDIHIKLENGRNIRHKRSHPECVVADAIPHVLEVEIGTRVLAKWYNRLDTYYPGTVVAIRRSFFDIRFDDGDKGCNELRELRILKQQELEEGKYYQVIALRLGAPRNFWSGCAARFSKLWPYQFRPKWCLKFILILRPGFWNPYSFSDSGTKMIKSFTLFQTKTAKKAHSLAQHIPI